MNKSRCALLVVFMMISMSVLAQYPYYNPYVQNRYPLFGNSKGFQQGYDARKTGKAAGIIEGAGIALSCWNTSKNPKLNVNELNDVCYATNIPSHLRGKAAYILALCHEVGLGLTRNTQKAMEYYLLASRNGDSRADAEIRRINKNGYRSESTSAQQIIISYFEKQYPSVSTGYTQSGNSSFGNPSPSRKSEEERREVTCTWCNGTGLVLKNERCPVAGIHNCVDVFCKQCGKSHCTSNTTHRHCPACDGVGKRKQKKINGQWTNEY